MKITTFNVNGVNGRLPVLLRWLAEAEPDIVCLQELKAPQEKFPVTAIHDAGYGAIWHGQKSWNGVAILARGAEPLETRRGLPGDPDDGHSRYIEAAINGLLIGCLYLPNGNPAPGPKFDYKLRWSTGLPRTLPRCWPSGRRWCWPATTTSCPPTLTSTSRNAGGTMRCSGPRCADQFQLGLEDIEQTIAENEAAQDAADAARHQGRQRRDARPNRNLGALPAHLPRYEVVIDVESRACPCCGGALHAIDELRTEQLDIAPAQLRVRVTRRPRYACRSCEGAVVVAPAPERPIDGGMATEALVAHVVVSKFCDSLPLYRQAQMLARQGVTLDRSTLSNWVGRACWWLMPLYDLVVSTVLSSDKLFADDTTLPVLDPGRGRTRTGRLWCYAVDDRPWCGPTHPAASYVYSEDRKGARPAGHLARFKGALQVDGYDGFKRIAGERADGSMRLAFCWAHMRRGFYQFYDSTKSPLAAEVLARIRDLYAIEAEVRGHPADHRRQTRQERSRPIVEALHSWLQDHLKRVSAVSDLAKAMRYALRHWPGLIVFLDDGRVEMDTNVVERAIRPHTLTRKNALFAGSDGGARHWAIAMMLIQTAKLNGVDPMAWLTDVLERVVSGRTKAHELHTLLPWNWRPVSTVELAVAA